MTEQRESLELQQKKKKKKAKQSYMKNLRRLEDLLTQLKDAKEAVEEDIRLISLDLEVYERDQRCITEIGMSVRNDQNSPIESQHFLIKEYLHLKNGAHIDDKSDRFEAYFGKTRKISLQVAVEMVQEEIDKGPFFIVAQDGIPDMDKLRNAGLNVNTEDLRILDTKELFCAFEGELEGRRLGVILYRLNLDFWNLHNAGNDARYTLEALLAIVSRPPIGNLQIPHLPENVDDTAEITALVVRLMSLGAEQAPSLQHAKLLSKNSPKVAKEPQEDDMTQEEWERALSIPNRGAQKSPLSAGNQFDDPEESADEEYLNETVPVANKPPALSQKDSQSDPRDQFEDAADDHSTTSEFISPTKDTTLMPASPISTSRGRDPYEESDHEYEHTTAFVGQKSGMTSSMAVFEDYYEYCSDLEDDENTHFHEDDERTVAIGSEVLSTGNFDRSMAIYSHEILNEENLGSLVRTTDGARHRFDVNTGIDISKVEGSEEEYDYTENEGPFGDEDEGNESEEDEDKEGEDEGGEDEGGEDEEGEDEEGVREAEEEDAGGNDAQHDLVPEAINKAGGYDPYEESDGSRE